MEYYTVINMDTMSLRTTMESFQRRVVECKKKDGKKYVLYVRNGEIENKFIW